MMATYEARIPDSRLHDLFLEIADLFGHAERELYVERYRHGRSLSECKREFGLRFGLTARQFNAIEATLRGKVEGVREGRKIRMDSLFAAIASAERTIRKIQREIKQGSLAPDALRKRRFTLHHKKRRLASLRVRLAAIERDQREKRIRICFGSRRLFHRQFHLRENGYASHEEWLEDFRRARSAQFTCLGSKDETSGNQSCTRMPDGRLRLRVPWALQERYGRHVWIEGIAFRYGQAEIDAALLRGTAVSYRFLRRSRRGRDVWYVQASIERPDAEVVTHRRHGGIGVDVNPSHIDIAEIDRFGNVIGVRSFPMAIHHRRKDQVDAALGEITADIVAMAKAANKPVVIEELDFRRKKAALRDKSPRYARMLSSFAYRKFHALLASRAARDGVEVITCNPAYTSVIGQVKFAQGYGISPHCAAALAIARRGLGFGERLRSRSAFSVPVRNREKHVWADWGRLARRLRAERGRRPSEGDRGRGKPLSSSASGGRKPDPDPAWDGSAAAPGCNPPAQVVGNAVRPAP